MTKPTQFEENIGLITAIAVNVAKMGSFEFEPDELVSEAWLRSNGKEYNDIPLLMKRVKWDMLDYIRSAKQTRKRTHVPTFWTNIAWNAPEGFNRGEDFLHIPQEDKSLLSLEQEELLIQLLLKSPTEKQLRSIFHYYFEHKSLVETGMEMGIANTTVCNNIKKGIARCQKDLAEMKLVKA